MDLVDLVDLVDLKLLLVGIEPNQVGKRYKEPVARTRDDPAFTTRNL
jgi:hypothetical protein